MGLYSQTPPNTGATPAVQPQIDPAQFALLQQLAQTAKIGSSAPVQVPPLSAQSQPTQGSSGGFGPPQPPYRDDRHEANRGDPRYGRYDNQGRGRGRSDFSEDRSSYRGNYRGTGFRGRGRGNFDDRDRDWFGGREGYKSPPPRSRRSRSRSPPRYNAGARRDVKPYSPPQRPTMATMPGQMPDRATSSHSADSLPVSSAVGPQKDEFGRDIRPQSPDDTVTEMPAQPQNMSISVERSMPTSAPQIPSVPKQVVPALAANTSSQIRNHTAAVTSQAGLDKFDMSTFDFTASSSWEVLGKMWQVTYGYLPSQEELMQFVMSGGVIASAAAAGLIPGQYPVDVAGVQQGRPQGNEGQWSGGMEGAYSNQDSGHVHGHGNNRNHNQQQWSGYSNTGHQQNTDAIVLGGGGDANGNDMMQVEARPLPQSSPPIEGGLGGRMQRVGDKWVFVRDGDTT